MIEKQFGKRFENVRPFAIIRVYALISLTDHFTRRLSANVRGDRNGAR